MITITRDPLAIAGIFLLSMAIHTPMIHTGTIRITTTTGMVGRAFTSVLVGIGLITTRHTIMDGIIPIIIMARTTEDGGIPGDMDTTVVHLSGAILHIMRPITNLVDLT